MHKKVNKTKGITLFSVQYNKKQKGKEAKTVEREKWYYHFGKNGITTFRNA